MANGLQRWTISLALMAATVAATFLAITSYFPGESYRDRLSAAYQSLLDNTTRTEFTDIMREEPWLYVLPAVGIIFVFGWLLPQRLWARAFYTYLVFGIGFAGGHVFW